MVNSYQHLDGRDSWSSESSGLIWRGLYISQNVSIFVIKQLDKDKRMRHYCRAMRWFPFCYLCHCYQRCREI